MLYSTWNWDTMRYDYFRADGGPSPGQTVMPRIRTEGESVRPEDVLVVLPTDAVMVGSGDVARGRVAVRPEETAVVLGFGEAPTTASFGSATALLLGGVLLWMLSR